MGQTSAREEEVPTYFDPKNIFYDNDGNIRFGNVTNDTNDEMRRVFLSDASGNSKVPVLGYASCNF
jgi:hypothetical protein